ncbi:MAG: siroheme synthase CysG [Gammaproteobacteria bacterium]|nr:siroheme synthase CysG [Gammaproteobacteria bacterium]
MLPLFWNPKSRKCLVVGGGDVAARKVSLLLQCGVSVSVVSPRLSRNLQEPVNQGQVVYTAREFRVSDLEGTDLAIAATDNSTLNQSIAQQCDQRGILVNVVDSRDTSSVIFGSLVDRDPVQVSVSSGGASPVLARSLRSRLEAYIPATFGELSKLVSTYRSVVKSTLPSPHERQKFWESILEGPVAELVLSGFLDDAKRMLERQLDDWRHKTVSSGEVYLVGAGPGDPDLLTFRALRLMQQADVVVYDRLVSNPILDLVRRGAEKVYAGKKSANHTIPQEGINALLVRLAKEGKRVLRLKGGDPFIFGRGGEEIETLVDEGITFQVVPGITAASGCATYAGIPLTHRDYSQACIFVTGHQKGESVDLHWDALAKKDQTVVFYMGLSSVGIICKKMIEHGLEKQMPAALIQQGTTPEQKVVVGTLEDLPARVAVEQIKAPTLIIIGEVVRLHKTLEWFQPKPSSAQ